MTFEDDDKVIAEFSKQRKELSVESDEKLEELEERADMSEIVAELCMQITDIRRIATQKAHAKVAVDNYYLTGLIDKVSQITLDHPQYEALNDRMQAAKAHNAALVEAARTPTPAEIPEERKEDYEDARRYLDMPLAQSLLNEMVAMLPAINQALPPRKQLDLAAPPEALISQNARALVKGMKNKAEEHKRAAMALFFDKKYYDQLYEYEEAKIKYDLDPNSKLRANAFFRTHAEYAKAIRAIGGTVLPFCPICFSDEQLPIFTCGNKHVYHKRCIAEWLKQSETCPLCKERVQAKDLV